MSTAKKHHFQPYWGLPGPLAQTLGGLLWPQLPDLYPRATAHHLTLRDGDQVVLHENRPLGWKDGKPIVILTHGLAGSWQSNYMIRFCRRFYEVGMLVIRMNQRGNGPGFGLAKKPGHSGRSEDLREVLAWVAGRFPHSRTAVVGVSLGGNITLKMCGEDNSRPAPNLAATVAISPPIDLQATADHLSASLFRYLDWYFAYTLYGKLKELAKIHPDIPVPKLHRWSLQEFDHLYTAPQSGFANKAEYYRLCSSKPLLAEISIPTLILMALDDPIVTPTMYRDLSLGPHTEVLLTEGGGHVGFLGQPLTEISSKGRRPLLPVRWMDDMIVHWVSQYLP